MASKETGWDQLSLGQSAASLALGPLSPSARISLLFIHQPLGVVLNQNPGLPCTEGAADDVGSGSLVFGVPLFAELNKDQLSVSASNIFLRGSLKALGWCCTALPAPQEMFARKSAAFVLSELVSLGNQLKAFQFGDPFLIN